MMPLAVLLHKKGHIVRGSDRAYDQGQTPDKFQALIDLGIQIFPQDGCAVTESMDYLVVSTAIENSIPDVAKALSLGISIVKRGQLLAELFNASHAKIAVAGTSGKSTVTGMIGTMLIEIGRDPTVVNGGEIINFRNGHNDKFAGIRKGSDDLFIAEMDESDGSVAHYNPTISLLNNIALDHMSMEELERLFGDYLSRTEGSIIANYDQPRVKGLCADMDDIISYSHKDNAVDLFAKDITPQVNGINFTLVFNGHDYPVGLSVPGKHNVENALAALCVCAAMDIDIVQGIKGIEAFKGIHRRMELIGSKGGVTVYDDFGHNPDKISASLETLKSFDGRLIVMFQPHGFGPLRLMGNEMIDVFAHYLDDNDVLIMPEVYYAGGTVDRSVTAQHIIERAKERGVNAHWFATRDEINPFLGEQAKPEDRIVIMGARDDTLHVFANEILELF